MTPSTRQPLRLRRLTATVPPGETEGIDYRELHSTGSSQRDNPAEGGSPNRMIGYLMLHWPIVLILGSVIGAGLAYAAYMLIPAKYTTTAMIRVALTPPSVSGFASEEAARNDFLTCLKTQTQLIKSHFVMNAAIRDPAIAELPMIKGQVDPVAFLIEEVRVEFAENSEIIKIILSGDNAAEITKIVNSIQDAYFREVVDDESSRKKARLVTLEDLLQKMEAGLTLKYGAIQDALRSEQPEKANAPVDPLAEPKAAPMVIVDDPINKAIAEATDINRKNQELRAHIAQLKSTLFRQDAELGSTSRRIAKIQQAMTAEMPADPASELKLRELIDKEPLIATQQQKILSRRKLLKYKMDNALNPNAPDLKKLADGVAADEAELKRLIETATTEFTKIRTDAYRAQIAKELELAQAHFNELTEMRKVVQLEVEKNEKEIKPTPVMPVASKEGTTVAGAQKAKKEIEMLNFLQLDISHREDILHKIVDKVNILRLEEKAPNRVRRFSAAPVPSKRESKKQLMATAGGGFMGFILVALGTMLFESRIRRTLSLGDVTGAARGPILGVIPGPMPDRTKGPLPATLAEAVDKCRTQIVQYTLALDHKSIMITSAVADEGKAFFAWQLTQSFVQSGYRTLLIDFDLRAPVMHDFYGVLNEGGVCEILRGEAELRNSIQTFSDGLSFLPAGKWTDTIRQDLVTDKIGMLLAKVREYYDCILIHAHPLLGVTDSYLIGRQVDSVIVTVQKLISRQPLLEKVQERAAELGKEPFGLVFLDATAEESLC